MIDTEIEQLFQKQASEMKAKATQSMQPEPAPSDQPKAKPKKAQLKQEPGVEYFKVPKHWCFMTGQRAADKRI